MAYRCKYCGAHHTKPETGRECHRLWLEKSGNTRREPLLRHPLLGLRSGRYALEVAGEKSATLVDVLVPDEGKWAGHVFLNLYDGPLQAKEAVTSSADREFITTQILQKGRRECMVAYGKLTRHCPVCNGVLDSEEEIAFGYHHQDCYLAVNK